jgi:polysaccharide biosynthesis/export protein
VKPRKSRKGAQVLGGLTLLTALLSALVGCSSTANQRLQDLSQLPPSQAATEVRATKPYVLEVGDEVVVTVWGYDDLKKTVIIGASGEIFYPMAGRLQLAGKSVPQAREMITAKLKQYYVDPQVDIVASTTGRQTIYVIGEVNTPTTISYTRPLLVTEAIAKASWFNQYANKSKVLLVRRADDQFHVYEINAGGALKDGSKAPPVFCQAGDIIYVPPTAISNLARFMANIQAILQPFMTLEQMIVLWPSLKSAFSNTETTGLSIGTSNTTSTSTTTSTTSTSSQ